jgi:hypothetical protein
VHNAIDVIGPGAIAFIVVLFAIGFLSLYVLTDSLRRPAHDYTGVREGRWFYAVLQGVHFVAFVLAQLPLVAEAVPWVGYIQIVGAPMVLSQQVAYLLRVVFPTQKRLEARAQAKEAALTGAYGAAPAHEEEADKGP